jgi:hypothetical protein
VLASDQAQHTEHGLLLLCFAGAAPPARTHLECVRISDFALVDDATIAFDPTFVAITGKWVLQAPIFTFLSYQSLGQPRAVSLSKQLTISSVLLLLPAGESGSGKSVLMEALG